MKLKLGLACTGSAGPVEDGRVVVKDGRVVAKERCAGEWVHVEATGATSSHHVVITTAIRASVRQWIELLNRYEVSGSGC